MRIGNGRGTSISTDKWGFEGVDDEVLRFLGTSISKTLVCDLWLLDKKYWNGIRVRELYSDHVGDFL